MNVLVIGSGGREHAISWKVAQSSQLNKLFIAPGNAGTAEVGTNVNLDANDFDAVKKFVLQNNIEMVIVGPEALLVAGIADYFIEDPELSKATLIGPTKAGAILEGSKEFAKAFMKRHNIPTAKYQSFTAENLQAGLDYLDKVPAPYVLKADGLAAGKGVIITEDVAEAKKELTAMLSDKKFGEAGSKVVIEQFLSGIELSVFIITDGLSYKTFPEAKDYKRIGEGDTGLNTGGMGAVSPVPFAGKQLMDKIEHRIIIPTVKGLHKEGIHYQGFIFFGVIDVNGEPYVIEYNCRLGDPETEVVLPRLKSDLLDILDGITTGTLSERDVAFDPRTAATVMLVSGGYPEAYEKGKAMHIGKAAKNSMFFHAGTTKAAGKTVTSGGRVLSVTAYGKDLEDALKNAYANVELVKFDAMNFRTDIGKDLIKEKSLSRK